MSNDLISPEGHLKAALSYLDEAGNGLTKAEQLRFSEIIALREKVDLAAEHVAAARQKNQNAAIVGTLSKISTNLTVQDLAAFTLYMDGHLSTYACQRAPNAEAGTREIGRAKAALQTAVTYAPTNAEFHLALARLYTLQGEKDQALAATTAAIRLDSQNVEAIRLLNDLQTKAVEPLWRPEQKTPHGMDGPPLPLIFIPLGVVVFIVGSVANNFFIALIGVVCFAAGILLLFKKKQPPPEETPGTYEYWKRERELKDAVKTVNDAWEERYQRERG